MILHHPWLKRAVSADGRDGFVNGCFAMLQCEESVNASERNDWLQEQDGSVENFTLLQVANETRVLWEESVRFVVRNEMLGQGGWGTVFLATRESDNTCHALKIFGHTKATPNVIDINCEIVLMVALAEAAQGEMTRHIHT